MGGVVSAEHGIGKKTLQDGTLLLDAQDMAMIPSIKKIKSYLDPHYILNRGNLIGI